MVWIYHQNMLLYQRYTSKKLENLHRYGIDIPARKYVD